MSDNQEIPWKRLTSEGFVAVVSILLAFGTDAWSAGRAMELGYCYLP